MPSPSDMMRRHKSVTSKVSDAFRSTFGGTNRVQSAVYRGRDPQGNPLYEVKYLQGMRNGRPVYVTRRFAVVGGRLASPGIGGTFRPGQLSGRGIGGTFRPGQLPAGGIGGTFTTDPPSGGTDTSRRGRGSGEGRTSGGFSPSLDNIKNKWLAFFTALPDSEISANTRRGFIQNIQNWNGSAEQLDHNMRLAAGNLPFGNIAVDPNAAAAQEDNWLDDFISGLGDGGGGGFAGPVYRAPDRRVVEDMVKGMMVSLIGQVNDGRVKSLTDIYMRDHRRNFDSMNAEIDPAQSVLENIRAGEDYRVAHAMRPESEDERTWISNRAMLAKRGGLNQEDVEGFAVTQATVGADEGDIIDAAASAQFAQTGSVAGTSLEERMKGAAMNMFRNVVV